eukprot:5651440-Karenia_brevis.AAC.1
MFHDGALALASAFALALALASARALALCSLLCARCPGPSLCCGSHSGSGGCFALAVSAAAL